MLLNTQLITSNREETSLKKGDIFIALVRDNAIEFSINRNGDILYWKEENDGVTECKIIFTGNDIDKNIDLLKHLIELISALLDVKIKRRLGEIKFIQNMVLLEFIIE